MKRKLNRDGIEKQQSSDHRNHLIQNSWPIILRHLLSLGSLVVILFLLGGCTSTTVLIANFKNDAAGSPPSSAQPTGTVTVQPGAGTVTVVSSPSPDLPSNNWSRIDHPSVQSNPTELTGNFTEFGTGNYGFLASLYIPSGSGVVTVQFEASKQSPLPFGEFLHLDFMPEGNVRIDDGPNIFGQFPRDQNFALSVNLSITETDATAEITLLGENASGNTTVNIESTVLPLARQFGAVTFHVGFFHKGTFFVDDIIVTRKKP